MKWVEKVIDINAILFPNVKSGESLYTLSDNKELEQKDIVSDRSTEADEDDSFEGAAEEKTEDSNENTPDGDDSESGGNSEDESEDDDADMPSGDDFDDAGDDNDDFGNDDESGDDGGDSDDDSSDKQGVEINLGSSLNPFTQVNQKLYLMDQMNQLHASISNAVNEFNSQFAETVELQQLKELQRIVEDEKESSIMQQNPENIVKYKLYVKQFSEIVENLTNKIKENNNVSI